MKETFQWNPHADQPHNVAPRGRRFRHHFRYAGGYFRLAGANLRFAWPVLRRYRRLRAGRYQSPLRLGDPFGIAVSPAEESREATLASLRELGITRVLFRIPSWERERMPSFEAFGARLREEGLDFTLALLQCRDDVLNPAGWRDFLSEIFDRFAGRCEAIEIGHAWNRTKWGVWDYREYLDLARAAFSAAEGHDVRVIGPAVIDFEFHLYPPVLSRLPFETVTSLLYVDRVGAPENRQCGWDTGRKAVLLRAIVETCAPKGTELWVTEVNWPLAGTGKYSPAAGKPNVSEEEQADFLVRYHILILAGGWAERIYWWQLAAPGYGLIDDRKGEWRRRPAFSALRAMAARLRNSVFLEARIDGPAHLFLFRRGEDRFAVGWSREGRVDAVFSRPPAGLSDRSGRPLPHGPGTVSLTSSPVYIDFPPQAEDGGLSDIVITRSAATK